MKIFLKGGEQIYLNGANIKVDRKVSIELLNKSRFLLKNHMLDPEEADSLIKQLYFSIQLMIVNPAPSMETENLYKTLVQSLLSDNDSPGIRRLIKDVDRHVESAQPFKALQSLRQNFNIKQ